MNKKSGRIILYYDESGEMQIKATGKLKKELEAELAAKAERDHAEHLAARQREVQSYEERYRKSPRGPAISNTTSPALSDAQKDMPVEHGTVPMDSELLQGHSPKHENS